NDSLVLGLKTWRVAPFMRGSSALPGVGMVKEPLDLKVSLSLPLLLTLSVSWVPGTVWSAARTGALTMSNAAAARRIIFVAFMRFALLPEVAWRRPRPFRGRRSMPRERVEKSRKYLR